MATTCDLPLKLADELSAGDEAAELALELDRKHTRWLVGVYEREAGADYELALDRRAGRTAR